MTIDVTTNKDIVNDWLTSGQAVRICGQDLRPIPYRHHCKAIAKRSKVSFGANRPFQGYLKSAIPFRHTGQPERGSLLITFSRQHGPFVLPVSRSLVDEGSTG